MQDYQKRALEKSRDKLNDVIDKAFGITLDSPTTGAIEDE